MELLAARLARRRATTAIASALLSTRHAHPLASAAVSQPVRRFGVQSATHGNLLEPRSVRNAHESLTPPARSVPMNGTPLADKRNKKSKTGSKSARASASASAAEREALVAELAASDVEALKTAVMASASSFERAELALDELVRRNVPVREKHYLSVVYKTCCDGHFDDVKRVFEAFTAAEAAGHVVLPPRADRTWNYLSFERLQMYRFVLWSMLDAKKYRQMNAFFRQHVHGRPNKWSLFESDPLNFLLRAECTGRFADELDSAWKTRIDTILRKMELWRFNASYSSSHALFRFVLYHPDVFIQHEVAMDTRSGVGTDPSTRTLGDVFVRYFNRYPKALRRDPKRTSIAISAAAAAGHEDVVKAIVRDAEAHTIRIDAVSFAHAVECAETEAKRMEIVELYVRAKERNAVYTTQNEPASISNYLLLYAIFDGNFRHMMELLHEMQLYNNMASNRTVEALFESVAKLRAQLRRDAEETGATPNRIGIQSDPLAAVPTIEDLLNDFVNVIPRNVHTITQGVLQSIRSGDLLIALRLVRATVRTTDIVLRREIYAQLAYPLLARGSAQYDELELLELERFYDTQHPHARTYLNAQVLNLCESNQDLVAMLACLDRWQLQRHAPLSRRALERVFDIVSAQLAQLRAQDAARVSYVVEGMELSYRAVLQRYFDIVPLAQTWPIASAIIRSGTSGLHDDVLVLLQQAQAHSLVLEPAAYRVALEVLDAHAERDAIRTCVRALEASGSLSALVAKYPSVQRIVEQLSETQTQE